MFGNDLLMVLATNRFQNSVNQVWWIKDNNSSAGVSYTADKLQANDNNETSFPV